MSKVYGIDLGTSMLTIYSKGDGIIYEEKNMIAVLDDKKVIAIGNDAFEMYGKAPSNIEVSYPVQYGVIADIKNMSSMINMVFDKIGEKHGRVTGGEFIITVPTDITEVEKRAFVDLIEDSDANPRRVRLVERPIADALGAGLNVTEAAGMMVVDIGADTTEISVLSLGGIVLSRMVPVGGNKMDINIVNAVRKNYALVIGEKTAENLKIRLGTAVKPMDDEIESMRVFGRDVISGLPITKEIDSAFIYDAIYEHLDTIVDSVKSILERTPPEIASDIIDSGIYVTGGSAQIKNMDRMLINATELFVNICEDPGNTVAQGLGRIIEKPAYDSLAVKLKTQLLRE